MPSLLLCHRKWSDAPKRNVSPSKVLYARPRFLFPVIRDVPQLHIFLTRRTSSTRFFRQNCKNESLLRRLVGEAAGSKSSPLPRASLENSNASIVQAYLQRHKHVLKAFVVAIAVLFPLAAAIPPPAVAALLQFSTADLRTLSTTSFRARQRNTYKVLPSSTPVLERQRALTSKYSLQFEVIPTEGVCHTGRGD